MSKKKKNKPEVPRSPTRRNSPPDLCAFPALAAWLSWANKTSEEEAQGIANMLAKFSDPGRAKIQFDRCESAAERLFLLGGMLINKRNVKIAFAKSEALVEAELHGNWLVGKLVDESEETPFTLLQQHQIEEYRVDFYLPEVRTVVEIDGYEFHGQKEQFIADKQRDRALTGMGYRVVRFSGSEVYADPCDALAELIDLASAPTASEEVQLDRDERSWRSGYEAGYAKCIAEFTAATDPGQPKLLSPPEAAE